MPRRPRRPPLARREARHLAAHAGGHELLEEGLAPGPPEVADNLEKHRERVNKTLFDAI